MMPDQAPEQPEREIGLGDCFFVYGISGAQISEAYPGPGAPVAAIAGADQFMAHKPYMLIFEVQDVRDNRGEIALLFRPSDMASLLTVVEEYEKRLDHRQKREFRRLADDWRRRGWKRPS